MSQAKYLLVFILLLTSCFNRETHKIQGQETISSSHTLDQEAVTHYEEVGHSDFALQYSDSVITETRADGSVVNKVYGRVRMSQSLSQAITSIDEARARSSDTISYHRDTSISNTETYINTKSEPIAKAEASKWKYIFLTFSIILIGVLVYAYKKRNIRLIP
jgi:hypothetical protein